MNDIFNPDGFTLVGLSGVVAGVIILAVTSYFRRGRSAWPKKSTRRRKDRK